MRRPPVRPGRLPPAKALWQWLPPTSPANTAFIAAAVALERICTRQRGLTVQAASR
jgi:hypothetical protein